MNLYPVFPRNTGASSFSVSDERDTIVELLKPPRESWVRAVAVTSADGSTQGSDGTSASLSKGADRALLGVYRELADLVIVGASTIRTESVPTPAHASLVILSRSGDLSGHHLVVQPGANIIVVTVSGKEQVASASLENFNPSVIALPERELVSGQAILKALADFTKARHVLVEGGRATWETFAGVTQEVCLAVSHPLTTPEAGIPRWWPGNPAAWTLTSLWTDDARMLYYRYLTEHSARPENSS